MQAYEKLGSFYMGRKYDRSTKAVLDETVLYDAKDLTTHAVCVGMTGSGKTGLCITLLEEAALDNIPAIIIDPKGDMTNLMLTFPDLKPSDFRPWINESDAQKKGITAEAFSESQATLWKDGLKKWDQTGERIQAFKHAADFAIFTPGSDAGIPISILKSFAAPPKELMDDMDAFRDRISTTVTGLLGLIGVDADPIKSREHILLSNILNHYWQNGQDLDLPALIQAVQSPPMAKIGVFDLESFFPSKERFELAMLLNNLLAAPGFESWLQGEAMDVNTLLYNNTGKPRISIFYIAHLSDAERMFFVSLLFNQILGWVRSQSGTTSLRALLYFDEIFGYLPPVGNPPSKKPLLTLLKQARAFGLGVVLATQNPVDLDYKGLSNTGTWFIGRLQTERDRDRMLDGLSGVEGASFDRKTMTDIITGLDKRVFLLHNVHESGPVVFHTRWAMSYLRGPMTRLQIKALQRDKIFTQQAGVQTVTQKTSSKDRGRPVLDPSIAEYFVPYRQSQPADTNLYYKPCLFASAHVHFYNKRKKVDVQRQTNKTIEIQDGPIAVSWDEAQTPDLDPESFVQEPEGNAIFDQLANSAMNPKKYKEWETNFVDYMFRNEKLTLFVSNKVHEISKPGEAERDFRIRLAQLARESRDEWMDQLREKYAKQTRSLEARIQRAKDRLQRERQQASHQKVEAAISIGASILGAFLGRKAVSRTNISKAGTALKRASRAVKETGDVGRAEDNLELLQQQMDELEKQFREEVDLNVDQFDVMTETFELLDIRPQKSGIKPILIGLTWFPYWLHPDGTHKPAWS